jgi:hypothetical protein
VRHAEIRRLAIALPEAAARSRPTVPSREAIVDELAVDLTSIALLRGTVVVTILFSISGAIPVPYGPVPACASRRGATLG